MDAYMYSADPYRQASASYYTPRLPPPLALDRRSSYALASADPLSSYGRVPLDPLAGYGAPTVYETQIVLPPPPRYVPPFRSRPRPAVQRSGAAQQKLGPKKKPFKQTQKVRFTEVKNDAAKKQAGKKGDKTETKAKGSAASQSSSLMQEVKDLHILFRTGVDNKKGEKAVANGTAKKRKADSQSEKKKPTKNSKKQKGKKKKLAKRKKAEPEKVEIVPPTEEQMKEAEASLDMQRDLCKIVKEFFVFPDIKEVLPSDGVEPEQMLDDSTKNDQDAEGALKDGEEVEKKIVEPERTPEEVKEVEANSLKFFSGFFTEHTDLRNLYIDKCNSGAFECLVCHSADPGRSKKFWNIVSLVTHTKMLKRLQPEHNGYGRSISAVLGWDHEKTPKVPRGARPIILARKALAVEKDESKEETAQIALEPEEAIAEDIDDETAAEVGSDI